MELRLGKTRISLHPLMLVFPAIAWLTGMRIEIIVLLLSLSMHEFFHWSAARIMHLSIERINLMPFGGAMYLGNPYILTSPDLIVVAFAGPFANLTLIFITAALAHWGILSSYSVIASMEINITLMLFNLLPVLPLDGGRILYGVLFPFIGRLRAIRIGIITGYVLSGILIIIGLISWIFNGILNLSFLFSAIFIITAAPNERDALCNTRIHTLLNELKPLSTPLPVNIRAVSDQCSLKAALRAANPNVLTLYAIYTNNQLSGFTDDRALLNAIISKETDSTIAETAELPIH